MWLQLIRTLGLLFFCFEVYHASGQNDTINTKPKGTEVDFLLSYYHQEGNNSAVTGGTGTEKLSDYSSIIRVNVPVKPNRNFVTEYGVSFYTSASSDNIDPYTISSASSYCLVNKLNFTSIHKDTARHSQLGIKAGGVHQSNFGSLAASAYYSRESDDKNREWKIQGSAGVDKWALYYDVSKLYPEELKGTDEHVDTDKRYSYSLGMSYKQVLTKRIQVQFGAEFIYQAGLLSTPFHRVYFTEQSLPKIEKLPSHRFRVPLTFRLNYFMFDRLLMRTWYRFYSDDFGMKAHSVNLELPVKVRPFFSVYPFFNCHQQSAVAYFNAYKAHTLGETYFTSDYDLSNLKSYEAGTGFYYSPVSGIFGANRKRRGGYSRFRKWELRYAYYHRSTGLYANIISTHFGFVF
jgi:hypothetical protein